MHTTEVRRKPVDIAVVHFDRQDILCGAKQQRQSIEVKIIRLTVTVLILVICSRNRVPRPGSKILYPVPNPGNYYPNRKNITNFGLYLHLFTMLNSIVALTYLRLHIHKLHRSF